MFIRVPKRKLFTTIILFNMLFSRDDLISQLDALEDQRSYFSMNISPDKATIALTNSNYTSLDLIGIKGSCLLYTSDAADDL